MLTHLRRHLCHWLRALANRVDPDRGDAYEAALREGML